MTDTEEKTTPAADPQWELWTSQQVADYLQREVQYFRSRIARQPGFPKPVSKLGNERINPMYYAAEIKQWVRDQRDAA